MIRIFKVYVSARVLVLFLSELVLIAFCYLLAGLLVEEVFDIPTFLYAENGFLQLAILLFSIVATMYFLDFYGETRIRSVRDLVQRCCLVGGIAFLFQGLLAYLHLDLTMPRRMMVAGSLLVLCGLVASRGLYRWAIKGRVAGSQILFIGVDPVVQEIAHAIETGSNPSYAVSGYVDDTRPPGSLLQGKPVLGPINQLAEIVSRVKPDRIVLGSPDWRSLPFHALFDLRLKGATIETAAALYQEVCGRISLRALRPSEMLFSDMLGSRAGSVALQSIYTNAAGLIGFLLLAPFLLLIAAAVKLSSRGPAFHGETRIGLDGVPFTLYHFRCYRRGPNAVVETRLGHYLRRTHLDSLPQIFNVMRGEMSFVGPRPERPEFAQVLGELLPYYRHRHGVKPGIVGWSQINQEQEDTLLDSMTRLEYDFYYVENVSLSLDAHILLLALKAMLVSQVL